ncbi:MAG: hypothetical protein CMM53_07415 [Rhodospirillaceae bacterium]|nr:hypothetical protein [Rhodospirillaceae bacterium]
MRWDGEIPYVVAVIALEERARLLSNIIKGPPNNVKCNMPVKVVFEEATNNLTLPKFTPALAN